MKGRRFVATRTFSTRAEAEAAAREVRGPGGGIAEIREFASEADVPSEFGRRPPKSERGLQLKRQREQRRLAQQAQEKAQQGIPISRAEREAAKRLTGKDVQPVSETARLQQEIKGVETIPRTALEREKAKVREERIERLEAKIDRPTEKDILPTTLSTGGVPLTILGDQRRMRVVPKEPEDLSRGFTPPRPVAASETILRPSFDITPEPEKETLFGTGGVISTREIGPPEIKLKPQEFVFESPEEIQIFASTIPKDRETRRERIEIPLLREQATRGGLEGAKASFQLATLDIKEGVKKFPVEEVIAFSALAAIPVIGPPIAGAVGTVFVATSIPSIKAEVEQKGVIRTVITELPTLAGFGLGARIGTKLSKVGTKALGLKEFKIDTGPKTERFFDINIPKRKATLTKVVGEDISVFEIDLVKLGLFKKKKKPTTDIFEVPPPKAKTKTLFRAADIPPSETLKKEGRVFGFEDPKLAEGFRRRAGLKEVFEFKTTDPIADAFPGQPPKVFARPIPKGKEGFEVKTSTAPEFIGTNIVSEKIVGQSRLRQRAARVASSILGSDIGGPIVTITAGALIGKAVFGDDSRGLEFLPAIPIIAGRAKGGRRFQVAKKQAARKSRIERQQQRGQFQPLDLFRGKDLGKRFVTEKEFGFKIRSPELKKRGVSEKVIGIGPDKIRITEKGIGPSKKGLTTFLKPGEVTAKLIVSPQKTDIGLFKRVGEGIGKSVIEKGTQQKKIRKTFSQAETLSKVRQAERRIDEVISKGKGRIVIQPLQKDISKTAKPPENIPRSIESLPKNIVDKQSVALFKTLKEGFKFKPPKNEPKPIESIQRNIVDAESLRLFKGLKPEQQKTRFKFPKETKAQRETRLRILEESQQQLRGGFRPGTKAKIIKRIQEREAQRRLEQEIAGEQGVLPGEFGIDLSGNIGAKIGEQFAPKKKKRKIVLVEEPTIIRGIKPVTEEVPAFTQLPTDIFQARGGLGPSRRLRQPRLPTGESLRVGAPAGQLGARQPLVGFNLGTQFRTTPIVGLGSQLGTVQALDLGLTQIQTPATIQAANLDVGTIPIIQTRIESIQQQDTIQDLLQEQITEPKLDKPVPEIPRVIVPERDKIRDRVRRRDRIDVIDKTRDKVRDRIRDRTKDRTKDRTRLRLFPLKRRKIDEPKKTFNVFVREGERRGDKFKRVATNLPRNKALDFGRNVVDNFVEASFRLKPTGKTTTIPDSIPPNLNKFRRPKGKTKLTRDTFVEKRRNRIDTFGEIKGLKFFKKKRRNVLL